MGGTSTLVFHDSFSAKNFQVCQHKLWDDVYNDLLESNVLYEGISTSTQVFYQK